MGTYEDELSYEQKMDQIAKQLEEMILNAFLKALKKNQKQKPYVRGNVRSSTKATKMIF